MKDDDNDDDDDDGDDGDLPLWIVSRTSWAALSEYTLKCINSTEGAGKDSRFH